MNILGISGLYHDSAAALLADGEIVAAVQEERFSRIKHDAGIPKNAMRYCLEAAALKPSDIDFIVFYDNPLLTLDRYIQNALASSGCASEVIRLSFENLFQKRLWVKELIFRELGLRGKGSRARFFVTKHHVAHAASAFFPSPYDRSVIITLDGVGEWTTLSVGIGSGNHIELKNEIKYPHSLGLFYSAFTWFCGFKVNSGDYKFMGLAPYGSPKYAEVIKEEIIDIKEDGSFALNLEYFDYQNGKAMVNEGAFAQLFGGKRRQPESMITEREMDIAASVQCVTEEIIIKIAEHAKRQYGRETDSLVMAGGVALNCVANGKLKKKGIFQNIWVQPAAGDAGGALGAALYLYYDVLGNERKVDGVNDAQKGSYLGPAYKEKEIETYLREHHIPYHKSDDCCGTIAKLLSDGKVIGVFRGRMEFGPRALGHRSIIADSRSAEMQSKLNLKIKYRESFRPFAPSILRGRVSEYFDIVGESPYMLMCDDIKEERRVAFDVKGSLSESQNNMLEVVNQKRSDIPAVTHVDYSARIQTVDGKYNQEYYDIIKNFYDITECPVIINTSFNVRGEPIVCSPEDAYRCFMRTEMDVLAIEDLILYKEEQPEYKESGDWREEYELD